jgi:hypothetical protein
MKLKYGYLVKAIPTWLPWLLLAVAFLLITIIPRFLSTIFIPDSQLAYLSSVNGDVNVSDGISDITVKKGALIARSERTLLKTGNGNASFKMRDSSFVILDSASTIEFNRQYWKDPQESFAFNLVSGRALVINGHESSIPSQIFVGGDITAQVFRAVIGLEARNVDGVHERVDCLIGPCVVNGVFQLVSGQSASISMDGTVQVGIGIPYDAWISLEKVGFFSPALSALITGIPPSITPNSQRPTSLLETAKIILIPYAKTATLSLFITVTNQPTLTTTPTQTITVVIMRPLSSFTAFPTNKPYLTSTPTQSNISTPAPTFTLSPTLPPILPTLSTDTPTSEPTVTLPSTDTFTPVPTDSPFPTDTLVPTIEPTHNHPPKFTKTSEPFPTIIPPDTPFPTEPALPTETLIPSN